MGHTILTAAALGLLASAGAAALAGETPRLEISAGDCWVDDQGAAKAGRCIKGWSGTSAKVRWLVEFATAGDVEATLKIAAPAGIAGAKVRVSLGAKSVEATVGRTASWKEFASHPAGTLTVAKPGRHVLTVQAVTKPGVYVGDMTGVVLSGAAAAGAKVIAKSTRADSVHLWWQTRAKGITRFYNEIIVRDSYPATFFMACGFHRGYFGMQEINRRRKVVIFSVWDPRSKEQDPRKVKAGDRVVAMGHGEGVVVTRFGNEGTGGKSMWEYDWKVGRAYRFCLQAEPSPGATTYTGWFYLEEKRAWKRIASFKVTGKAETLRGLYSFVEDWRGHAAHKFPRRALFGNAWVRDADGKWSECTRVRSTQAGKLPNVNAGVVDGRFLLATGADVKDTRNGQRVFDCKPHPKPPTVRLPKP